MSTQENIKLDDAFIAAWNTCDPDQVLALVSDDVSWKDVTTPEPLRGKAAVRQYLQGWFTPFPDLKARVKHRVTAEDQVATAVEWTATNSGPLQMAPNAPALPATGRKVMGQGSYFLRIRNGKAAEIHSYPDMAGVMMQLGLMGGS